MRKQEFEFTVNEVIDLLLQHLVNAGDAKSGQMYSTALRIQHNPRRPQETAIFLSLGDPK